MAERKKKAGPTSKKRKAEAEPESAEKKVKVAEKDAEALETREKAKQFHAELGDLSARLAAAGPEFFELHMQLDPILEKLYKKKEE